MIKDDLWCGYDGSQEFEELPDEKHPTDLRYSTWRCLRCNAVYENNDGYGYFTVHWGDNDEGSLGTYCLNSGELLDDTKLPRTPEGIVRSSGSKEQLEAYLVRTQIK